MGHVGESMDKGRSRTDLLTAGRKKLQQFRKNKDNKGGSSHAKASGKASKPEKDGDPDEHSKISEAHPVSDADTMNEDGRPADFPAVPSSGEPEEVPTISLVDQEANRLGSEQCNGESFVGGADVDLGSEGAMEDVDSDPSYGTEMVREVDESSIPSHEQLGDCPVSNYADNGTDGRQIPIEESGRDIETPALAQETNHSSVAADELHGAGGGSTHAEENMEMPSSSQNYSSNKGTDDGAMIEPEEKERTNVETFVLVEELPEAGPDFSGDPTEGTSLGESSLMPRDIPAAEGAECFFAADGEDEHRDDEKGMHSQGNPEANRVPVPGTLQQDTEHLSIKTEESTFLDDTLGTILSMSQDTPASEGRDGSFIAVEDGGREKDEEGLHQFGETHVTSWSSICGEALQEANTNFSDKPEVITYNEENLETLARPSEDIPENKEVCGVKVDLEEVRRANEGGLLLSSLGDDVTVDSECTEEFQKKWPIIFGEKGDKIHKVDPQAGNSGYEVEGVKELLYKTMVEKDIFQFQLAEQIKFSTEYQQHSSDEISKLWGMMKETQTSKALVDEELEQNRSRLQAMSTAKEELEALCLSAKGEIQELHSGARELQSKLEQSQEELSRVLIELADCRVSLEAIQKEKLDLAASLNSETDMRKKIMEENERSREELARELADCRGSLEAIQKEKLDLEANLNFETNARKKLVEENEFYSCENKKLAGEMLEQKERLVIALDKQAQLQSDLRDTVPPFEQLAEENMYLSSSLDIHKAKIKELEGRQMESLSQANKAGKEDMSLIKKDDVEDSSNSFDLGVLKQCLDRANNIMQDLENSVEGMHSLSMSLRSGGRAAGSGISKIIQAFESKAQQVESVADDVPFIEGGHSEDSYTFIKEHTCNLKHILKKMEVDVGKAETHCMEIQNRRNLPEQFVKSSEENSILQERISKLVEKMSEYESRISDLQNYIDEIQLSAKDEAARLSSQVDILQKEVNERVSILQQEEDSIRGILVEAIEKLDTSTGLQVNDNSDVGSHVIASVDAAVLEIKSLHEKIEASHLKYNILQISHDELNKLSMDMQGKVEIASAQLSKFYNSIREFVNDSNQDAGDALVDVNANEALGVVHGNCHFLIERLKVLLDERLHVLSTNAELEAMLSNRNLEIEELSMRYHSLVKKLEDECHSKQSLESNLMDRSKIIEELNNMVFTLVEKLEDHGLSEDLDAAMSGFAKSDNTEHEFDRSLLLRLEALIASHLKRYEEAVEQINLSKSYLQEVNISTEMTVDNWSLPLSTLIKQEFVPKVSELQESLQLLSDSNLQHETKIRTLKENLSKLEATLEESHSELNLKISELEQSEQRLSSVREKLSIAVAKGKGLIVQRDSLKQSLNEKSNELEKCMQELQSKEALLQEAEAKLKSCSEVDRVEALESELSYIRDSATALRDSFLLKDSVLQRIEEVLEDLDLPEHFHSKDIVEKIELLSRVVVGNPSLTDWDQNLEGHSHSDAGFGIDAWKDDITSPNHEFDELKRKYEELERKFYALAEHNDMLEQSLMERNSLVQKWEEMMDKIDIPPHLRTLEPEDRIKCLGRALSEIQQERDALQVRIENLEVSSDMLVVDVEESHKKISELSAELMAVKSEKEFYSGSLDKLRQEYLALSEKAVHEEFDRENLQKEVAKLQAKLVEEVENRDRHDIETDVQKLLDLVTNALPDSDKVDVVFSGGSGVESLEKLLRKLIDNYTTMSTDRSMHKVVDKEVLLEENNLALDEKTSGDVMDDKDQELVALRSGLDESSHSLSLVKQERDAAMAKCNTSLLEIEEMTSQMKIWQDQRISDTQKYQALLLELEATGKQRDALQEQLNQEEQKSAVAREKLNVAVRKGKGLVQQRDALKQTIEEMNHVVEHSKIEHNQQLEALKSEKTLLLNQLTETEQKFQESSENLNRLLTVLNAIYVSSEVNIVNPVQKLEEIGKLNNDLQSALVSSEHEARKSKRTAELLLAELNEVQERADILHEELEKAEAALMECSKQKDVAEVTKADAVSRLEQIMQLHSDERKKQINNMVELKSGFDQLKNCCLGFSSLLSSALRKDVVLFSYVESFLKDINGEYVPDLQFPGSSNLLFNNPTSEDCSHALDGIWDSEMHSLSNDSSIPEQLVHACATLHECLRQYDHLKECIEKHSFSIDQQSKGVFEALQTVKGTVHSQKEISESLRRDVSSLELMLKGKETESSSMRRNISVLYEACNKCIAEVENRNGQMVVNNISLEGHLSGKSSMSITLPSETVGKEYADGHNFSYTDESIRLMADSLLSTVKGSKNIDEIAERNQRESRETILKLQGELQEKNREMNQICEELVSQIREAEARAKRSESELDSSRIQVFSLEKEVAAMVNDKKVLESRVSELKNCEASLKDLQDRFKVLTDTLEAKDQEIEALTQALDEEETQMEALENRNMELENAMQGKRVELENLEASRAKTLAKLSTTVSKFDELHNLSESLLAEIESLQSQLQERDSEVSFLRQEVTRCTNDVLASQETSKNYSSEMHELLSLMEKMATRFGGSHVQTTDQNQSRVRSYIDIIDKKFVDAMDELEDLRVTVQSKDSLLQIEKGKVEELLSKMEELETLSGKGNKRERFQGERDSGPSSSMNSPRTLETEQMVQRNKVSSGPIAAHIRSARKVNNDQIAIAIDVEKDDNTLDDEDDDKAHGFKSLTMSRLIPRATRPISDRIDGIWVSAERLLMRQPSLRLGVIIYWVVLHALLASFI